MIMKKRPWMLDLLTKVKVQAFWVHFMETNF